MSESSLYDTDGRRVDTADDADEEIRGLIRSLSKSEFVDAYYDGAENFLCYRIEGKYTGPHSRGGREQSFYFVITGLDTFDNLQNEFTSALASDNWDPTSDYGDIDRPTAADIQYLIQQPRDRNAVETRKQQLLGDLLSDGGSDFRVGVSTRNAALKLLALYSPVDTTVVVGSNVDTTVADRADLVIEYGYDSEFVPLNESTKRRLSARESEYKKTLVAETLSDVENQLQTLSEQTSMEAEIEALQQIKKSLNSGGQRLPSDSPSVGHDLVTLVQNAQQNLDQRRRQKVTEDVEDLIETRINTILTSAIGDSVDRISETLQTEVERLEPLLSDTPSKIRSRLLNKTVPEEERTHISKSQTGLTPNLHPPDVALGAFAVLTLVLVVVAAAAGTGVVSFEQGPSPSDINIQTSSAGSDITVVGSAPTDTVEVQLAERTGNEMLILEQSATTSRNGRFNTTLSDIDDGTYLLAVIAGNQSVTNPVTVDSPVALSVSSPTWGDTPSNSSSATTLEVNGTTNGTQVRITVRNVTTGDLVVEEQSNVTDSEFSLLFENIQTGTYHLEVKASNGFDSEAKVTRTIQIMDSESTSIVSDRFNSKAGTLTRIPMFYQSVNLL